MMYSTSIGSVHLPRKDIVPCANRSGIAAPIHDAYALLDLVLRRVAKGKKMTVTRHSVCDSSSGKASKVQQRDSLCR